MKPFWVALMLATVVALGVAARLAEAGPKASRGPASVGASRSPANEANVEREDRVAAQAFEVAIAKLDPLVRAKKGRPEAATLTLRLLETYAKLAAVHFRLSHSPQATAKDKAAFKRSLEAAQSWASLYVTQYPRGEGVARAIYLRAKARSVSASHEASIADYRYLIDQYPGSPDRVSAHFALYELLIKKEDFRTAITYHRKLGATPEDAHYALVMDQLAFAHYSLNEIPQALKLLESELPHFAESEAMSLPEVMEREKIFGNIALYYFTAIDRKLAGFTQPQYLAYILKLKPGATLGRALTLFANLMRTRGWDAELQAFQAQVLAAKISPVAQAEVVLTSFESQIGKRRWGDVRASAQTLTQLGQRALSVEKDPLRREKLESRIRKLMSSAVESLQKSFMVTRGRPEGKDVTEALLAVYEILLRSSPDPSSQAQLRFNLAETHSANSNLAQAVPYYRSVLELSGRLTQAKDRALIPKAAFQAMALRYELLNRAGSFPKELKPMALAAAAEKPLAPAVEEWIAWVDEGPRYGAQHEEVYPTFRFEAARSLYQAGRVRVALDRLKGWIAAEPTGKYAVPAASLVVDTYLAGQEWALGYALAAELERRLTRADATFKARLREVAADCSFRLAEEAYRKPDYADAIRRVEALVQAYPTSSRMNESLTLAANAALALQDKARALSFFTRVKQPSTDVQVQTTLTAVALDEETYRFTQAYAGLKRAVALPVAALAKAGVKVEELNRKALLYAWLSGDDALLAKTVNDRVACAPMAGECGKFALTRAIYRKESIQSFSGPYARWAQALIRLEGAAQLSMNDITQALDTVAGLWAQVDPAVQITLVQRLLQAVPPALDRLAPLVERATPIALDKKAMERRSRLIETVGATLDRLGKLPFVAVQVASLQAWADLYADFTRSVRKLPKPAGLTGEDLKAYEGMVAELTAPFHDKAVAVREKAIAKVSESGVHEVLALKVWRDWVVEKPEALVELGGSIPEFPSTGVLTLAPAAWVAAAPKAPDTWKRALLATVQKKSPAAVAFLIQDAKEKNWLSPDELQGLRGFNLLMAGAQAEGVTELSWVARKLEGVARAAAISQVATASVLARSRSKAKAWLEFLANETDPVSRRTAGAISPVFFAAVQWTAAQVDGSLLAEWRQAVPSARLPAGRGGRR